MKRVLVLLLLVVLAVTSVMTASAGRKVGHHRGNGGGGGKNRTVVVVNNGWPLRRPARTVWVRPARSVVTVRPAVYLTPVVFAGIVISTAPRRELLVWEDSETLLEDQDWTEFTLRANSRGSQLWFQVVGGRVQVDWAEVVFDNGECRVVDFRERTCSPGTYSMANFANGRRVDHVRMIARSRAPEARVVLRMQ